jgi:hypothetical protein
VNRAIRERGRERLVHEPVLLEQRQAVEPRGGHSHLEVVATAGSVLNRNLGRVRKRLPQDRLEPLACHGFDASRAGNDDGVRWKIVSAGVLYFALAALTAIALLLYGALDCYEECRYDVPNPPWPYDIDAWQWDAILWLGVASGIASLAFLVAVFRFGALSAAAVLAAHVSLVIVGGAFVRAAGETDASLIVLVAVGLAAPGAALIASRASSRAGARGTRAGPTG